MGKCINHPDRETSYLCMKHNIYLCDDCLQCRDPELYCKFRPSCPIWFLSKEKRRGGMEENPERSGCIPIDFSRRDNAACRNCILPD
jgi:hypothetical protein